MGDVGLVSLQDSASDGGAGQWRGVGRLRMWALSVKAETSSPVPTRP